MSDTSAAPGLSLPAKLVIAALVVFGALAAIQWIIGALFGLIRFILLIALVIGIAGLVFWGGPTDSD